MRKFFFLFIFSFSSQLLRAQDDLLSLLDSETKPVAEHVTNAFKSTRVIMSHSLEHVGAGVLDFRIMHRFGHFSGGHKDAWGFDNATMRISFDYGITNRFTVGLGRSTFKKEADAFLKYRLLWQTKGAKKIPVTVEYVTGITADASSWAHPDRTNYFSSRLGYYHQLIVGKKFNDRFSLQLSPILIHRNYVETLTEKNDVLAGEIGTRIKLTKRFSLNLDYFYFLPGNLPTTATRPLSIGVDIETGGHVFQLHFTNTSSMNERAVVTETNGDWLKGDIAFGFNLSRVFTIDSKKRKA